MKSIINSFLKQSRHHSIGRDFIRAQMILIEVFRYSYHSILENSDSLSLRIHSSKVQVLMLSLLNC